MQKYLSTTIIVLCLLLSSCRSEAVPETTEEPVVTLHVDWEDVGIDYTSDIRVTIDEDNTLNIFPDKDSNEYISMRKIFISNNNFWNVVEERVSDELVITGNATLFNYNNYAVWYLPIDDESCYVAYTDTCTEEQLNTMLSTLCNFDI